MLEEYRECKRCKSKNDIGTRVCGKRVKNDNNIGRYKLYKYRERVESRVSIHISRLSDMAVQIEPHIVRKEYDINQMVS